jgi:hypothetical protein
MSMSPENAGEPWLDDEYRTAGSPVFLRSEASDRLEISEYSLKVGGELYRVRRAVDRDMQGGFVTIKDSGDAVLVFSASFPDQHVHQLIVAWRTSERQGLDRGRREAGGLENVT